MTISESPAGIKGCSEVVFHSVFHWLLPARIRGKIPSIRKPSLEGSDGCTVLVIAFAIYELIVDQPVWKVKQKIMGFI